MSTQDTFALTYHDKPSDAWWFIPTVPEARKWRGPYARVRDLDDAITAELGADCTVHQTTVQPSL